MRLAWLFASAALLASPGAAPAEPKPEIHASASCAPAPKPGRIRCRAVLELPLDVASKQRLAWGELRVVTSHPSVTPLRGRLGPLDAEIKDDARIAWSFSVAAAEVGERSMTLRLVGTVVASGEPRLVERTLDVPVRVEP